MDDQQAPSGPGPSRRDFLATAVAIGGTAALTACLERESGSPPTGEAAPKPAERQHAWNGLLPDDQAGTPIPPRHHVLLLLEYDSGETPGQGDREAMQRVLRGLEGAYGRHSDGLLMTVGYSRAYFERFDAELPETVDLPRPEALAPFEDPDLDEPDTLIHLASNRADVVLGAEEAMRGNRRRVNDVVQPENSITDLFQIRERRTGFVGSGMPARHDDTDGVPDGAVDENAPFFMGFESNFEDNQSSEDAVTIRRGPFGGGTTQHVSRLRLELEDWYQQDSRWQREAKMFCPDHATNDVVEGSGTDLDESRVGRDCEEADRAARRYGVVGHAQKVSRARRDDDPRILRRDFDTVDGDHAGVHFVALQRRIADFVTTREEMNGREIEQRSAVGKRTNNGILQYIRAENRGNYLLPPTSLRALPTPTGTSG